MNTPVFPSRTPGHPLIGSHIASTCLVLTSFYLNSYFVSHCNTPHPTLFYFDSYSHRIGYSPRLPRIASLLVSFYLDLVPRIASLLISFYLDLELLTSANATRTFASYHHHSMVILHSSTSVQKSL